MTLNRREMTRAIEKHKTSRPKKPWLNMVRPRKYYVYDFKNPPLIAKSTQNLLKKDAVFVCRNVFQNFIRYFNLVKTQVKQAGFEPC